VSKFSDAAYAWMQKHKKREVTTDDLWTGLSQSNPELTTPSEHRKTPRTTCMRDLRKDERFQVGDRRVSLTK
jgi:hypothetical protein